MAKELKSGAVVTSNLTAKNQERAPMAGMFSMNTLQLGQVIEVLHIDHPRSRSKRFTEYDVLVDDGNTMSRYRNCRAVDTFGDENNFSERTYNKVTEGKRGKKDDAETFHFKNGAIVMLAFIGGHKESAVIMGGLQHPNIRLETKSNVVPKFEGSGSSDSRDARMVELPTLNPGVTSTGENGDKRILGEFQGLRWNINKDGEMTIVYQGPKDGKGQLTATATQPTVIKITKDGEFLVIDNLDQEIKISRKERRILISDGNEEPDFIEIDRDSKNITIQTANKEIHNVGENYEANIKGDELVTIEGNATETVEGDKTIKVENNQTENVGADYLVKVDGKHRETVGSQWRVQAGGPIMLESATVIKMTAPAISIANALETVLGSDNLKLGGIGATHPVMLGDLFQTVFNAFVSVFNAHTHSGAVPPPSTPAVASTSAELSDTVKVDKTSSGNPDVTDQ